VCEKRPAVHLAGPLRRERAPFGLQAPQALAGKGADGWMPTTELPPTADRQDCRRPQCAGIRRQGRRPSLRPAPRIRVPGRPVARQCVRHAPSALNQTGAPRIPPRHVRPAYAFPLSQGFPRVRDARAPVPGAPETTVQRPSATIPSRPAPGQRSPRLRSQGQQIGGLYQASDTMVPQERARNRTN
jgi:hypothetical protein